MPHGIRPRQLASYASLVLVVGPLLGAAPNPTPMPLAPMPPVSMPPPLAPLLTLKGHTKGIFQAAWSPNGKLLATCSRDHTAKIWDAASGKALLTLKGHTGRVHSAAFRPDGKLLATASEDHGIRLWDSTSGKEVRRLDGHSDDVYTVAWSPDGKRLASCSDDHSVRIWDADAGKVLHTLQGHSHRVLTVAFSPDGRRLASACPNDSSNNAEAGEVKLWDAATGAELFAMAGAAGVTTVAFSPDGKRLAGACLGQTVKIWEAATGREALALAGHSLHVYCVAFSPDGRRLASCSGRWDEDKGGEVKVWDVRTSAEILNLRAHAAPIWNLSFRPDGTRLATASGYWNKDVPGEVKIWDMGRVPVAVAPALAPKDLDALWADLTGDDAVRAYAAVLALAAAPDSTLPFLDKHVRPPAKPATGDLALIPKLIEALDDNRFETREKAAAALEQMGRAAHPALKAALESPSAEVRRRARELLARKSGEIVVLSPDELRGFRTIEVLQQIDSPAVRPLLQRLAEGDPSTTLGRDAAAALAWLERRPGR